MFASRTRACWKAQNKSLQIFSGEAYNVEQGVTNEVFQTEREEDPACATNGQPEDQTHFDATTITDTPNDAVQFSIFMRFLAAPQARLSSTRSADGITQGGAGPDEFRTAPLWGIGQRIFFLHDGRTSDLAQAIRAHASAGSEANAVIARFDALLPTDQQNILLFLRSL